MAIIPKYMEFGGTHTFTLFSIPGVENDKESHSFQGIKDF